MSLFFSVNLFPSSSVGTCRQAGSGSQGFMFYVYALKSKKTNKLYIGISEDPSERLKQHNLGMTKSTKFGRPYELIYTEVCADRKSAREKEKKFKSGSGREFLKSLFPSSSAGRAARC